MSLDIDEIDEMMGHGKKDRFRDALKTSKNQPAIPAFAEGILKKSCIVYDAIHRKLGGLGFVSISDSKPLFSSSTCFSQQKLLIASNLITICCSPLGVVTKDDCLLELSRNLSKSNNLEIMLDNFYSHELDRLHSWSVIDLYGIWVNHFCLYTYDSKKEEKYRIIAAAIDEAVREAKKMLQ